MNLCLNTSYQKVGFHPYKSVQVNSLTTTTCHWFQWFYFMALKYLITIRTWTLQVHRCEYMRVYIYRGHVQCTKSKGPCIIILSDGLSFEWNGCQPKTPEDSSRKLVIALIKSCILYKCNTKSLCAFRPQNFKHKRSMYSFPKAHALLAYNKNTLFNNI